jgi:hypothetical protein
VDAIALTVLVLVKIAKTDSNSESLQKAIQMYRLIARMDYDTTKMRPSHHPELSTSNLWDANMKTAKLCRIGWGAWATDKRGEREWSR